MEFNIGLHPNTRTRVVTYETFTESLGGHFETMWQSGWEAHHFDPENSLHFEPVNLLRFSFKTSHCNKIVVGKLETRAKSIRRF